MVGLPEHFGQCGISIGGIVGSSRNERERGHYKRVAKVSLPPTPMAYVGDVSNLAFSPPNVGHLCDFAPPALTVIDSKAAAARPHNEPWAVNYSKG